MTAEITVTLGPEYDEPLRQAVRTALDERHARVIDRSWGVGGSQEVNHLKVLVDGEILIVEAETYIGLSITGPPGLVDDIARAVASHYTRLMRMR